MGLWSGLAEAAAEWLRALRGVRRLRGGGCQRIWGVGMGIAERRRARRARRGRRGV